MWLRLIFVIVDLSFKMFFVVMFKGMFDFRFSDIIGGFEEYYYLECFNLFIV